MNTEIIEAILEVVFQRYFVYLTPVLFLLMVVLFADRIVDLIYNSIATKSRR